MYILQVFHSHISQQEISSVTSTQGYPTHVQGLQLSSSPTSQYYSLAIKQTGCVHNSETSHPSHRDASALYSGPVTVTASAPVHLFQTVTETIQLSMKSAISFQAKEVGRHLVLKLHNQNCRGRYLTLETKV